ncbi:hypothetical protein GCM10010174_28470 [Kutzneria viridogrisea]|uniref:Uncharacterized protein n=2 Tax=Kutzneria TaxID=43356 RepID=W5W0U3_9PSEU|nr:hypothetical protein [Kutzneria albida]AHH94462.1 hypothetical protein KALB_1089 [Kutzneria albida DSM 43870]MBA8930130.1 hypothetical protein [Kutzneria viridogrisea]
MAEPIPCEQTREVTVEVGVYDPVRGLARTWPQDYSLSFDVTPHGDVVIRGDKAGLRGLATQLLALAESDVPPRFHFRIDDFMLELDRGSMPVRIEQRD